MDEKLFLLMEGEWIGTGEMTVGNREGAIIEALKLEPTDFPLTFSYIRKSRITFQSRTALHNEFGYMRAGDMSLLLSRGSYEILEWVEKEQLYRQIASSPDSRNMTRKVQFPNPFEMVWDNAMEVDHQGQWVKHTAVTKFTSITRIGGLEDPCGPAITEFDLA